MTSLRPLTDTGAADWVVEGIAGRFAYDVASVVPPVFDAYARLQHPFDSEADQDPVDVAGHLEDQTLGVLIDVLARHTTTPKRCYFCLWDGFGDIHGSPSVAVCYASDDDDGPVAPPTIPPAFAQEVMNGPRVVLPSREYLLFEGPLADAGRWGAADLVPGMERDPINSPNLFWPADRAWLVATEIDLPATYVGGSEALISELVDGLPDHHDLVIRRASPKDGLPGDV